MSSVETTYGGYPIDRAIASVMLESFAISQGDTGTHSQTFAVYAYLQPGQAAEQLAHLNNRWLDHDLRHTLATFMARFANRDEHAFTRLVGGALTDATSQALDSMREAYIRIGNRKNITEIQGQRLGALLGRDMLRRDYRFLSYPDARAKAEPSEYSLLRSRYNSHWLHYAYLADPKKMPGHSIRHAAIFGAQSLCDALEARDTNMLLAASVRPEMLAEELPLVVATHLRHYPQHADRIPADMLLDRARDATLIASLVL